MWTQSMYVHRRCKTFEIFNGAPIGPSGNENVDHQMAAVKAQLLASGIKWPKLDYAWAHVWDTRTHIIQLPSCENHMNPKPPLEAVCGFKLYILTACTVSMSLARCNNNTNVIVLTSSTSCRHCAVLSTITFMFYHITLQ